STRVDCSGGVCYFDHW
nr:immunoglobulin heavy chain junction region [Macaca mulatta]MOX60393.1 immunoglobulin heavy chain junction region [Macaca mulatta]MOX62081.1 immunoglobulin heavy chain junction region [Macaca mulatta]MOX62273.1 immunoglobulin heavy chain junction region [Macaca mulatta]MOX64406.1 immunoglobulin heavy chain junction region [Macaca mulatta]